MARVNRQVSIIGRKNGSDNNLFSVVCDLYDMSAYVDYLREIEAGKYDYLIIEPVFPRSLFDNEKFW